MKIRDGVVRLRGRKAAQAPATAKHRVASAVSPDISASAPAPTVDTNAIEAAAPSMLSMMLKAFTTPTTQKTVSSRSAGALPNTSQPRPVDHSTTAIRTSTTRRIQTERLTRSSIVPTRQIARPHAIITPCS